MVKNVLVLLVLCGVLSASHYYVYDKGVDKGIELYDLALRSIKIEWVDDIDCITPEEFGDANFSGGETRLHREALTP